MASSNWIDGIDPPEGGGNAPPTPTDPYDQYYQQAGKQYGIDPAFLRAIAAQESSENPKNINHTTNASGLMGWMPEDAKKLGFDPFDPQASITHTAQRLRNSLNSGMDPETALMEYYGGADRKKWGPNTQAYPAQVLARYPFAPGQMDASAISHQGGSNWIDSLDNSSEVRPEWEGFEPQHSPTIPPFSNSNLWGPWHEFTSAIMGGYGPELEAGELKAAAGPNADTFTTQDVRNAKAAYERANPGASFVQTLLGNTAVQAPLLASGEGLLTDLGVGKVASILPRAAQIGLKNAAEGAASGLMSAHENPGQSVGSQALGGALGNTLLGGVGAHMFSANIDPHVAQVALALKKTGVNVPLSQIEGAPNAATFLQNFFGKGKAQLTADQGAQFTRAVSNSFGENTDTITPNLITKVLGDERSRTTGTLQAKLNSAVNGMGTVPVDPKFTSDLTGPGGISSQIINDTIGQPEKSKALLGIISSITDRMEANGETAGLPAFTNGKDYSSMTAGTGILGYGGDAVDRLYKGKIRDALENLIQRNGGNPNALQAFSSARMQYKNARIAQTALAMDPDSFTTGKIDPVNLAKASLSSGMKSQTTSGKLGSLQPLAEGASLLANPNTKTPTLKRFLTLAGAGASGAGAMAELTGAHALHHMATAMESGFNPMSAGATAAGLGSLYGLGKLGNLAVNNPFTTRMVLESAARGRPGSLPFQMSPWMAPTNAYATNSLFRAMGQ